MSKTFPNFNSSTTSTQVTEAFGESAAGKTFMVTGAGSGLGFETAKMLAKTNAKEIVVLTRSQAKSDETVEKLKKEVGETKCILTGMECDLGSMKSVKQFVNEYKATKKPLNVLINNAGIMGCPKTLIDGMESQFAVNHLGHFALTEGLLDTLRKSATYEPSRVVSLSSLGHAIYAPRPAGILFDDLDASKSYDEYERYGQSKLANVLLAKGIALQEDPNKVVAYSLHPGVIMGTSLMRHISLSAVWSTVKGMWKSGSIGMRLILEGNKSVPQGSATTLVCALAPIADLKNGGYYADCNVETYYVHPAADNDDLAKKLWKVSHDIIAQK
jgi:NAD(P)-dependent dehydrogenase (short-subunit alcohol dehydrogenase family)